MSWDRESVQHRQAVFCMTVKKQFLTKITKYQNILLRNGLHFLDSTDQIWEEQEIIISPNSFSFKKRLPKQLFQCGSSTSLRKVSYLIYSLIARPKAGRICTHLDGVTDTDIKATIEAVATEMSVAYEYQLMMLYSDTEVVRLAEHAVACMLTYLDDRHAEFSSNGLLTAVLEVKPNNSNKKEVLQTRTVVHNGTCYCLRWKIGRILKEPGLRVQVRNDIAVGGIKQMEETEIQLSAGGTFPGSSQTSRTWLCSDTNRAVPNDNITSVSRLDEVDGSGNYLDALSVYGKESAVPSDMPESGNWTNTCSDTNAWCSIQIGLQDVSSALLGHLSGINDHHCVSHSEDSDSKHFSRRLNSVSMDFDNNVLLIQEHACQMSLDNFSPLNSTSEQTEQSDSLDREGDDTTDIEEGVLDECDVNDTHTRLRAKECYSGALNVRNYTENIANEDVFSDNGNKQIKPLCILSQQDVNTNQHHKDERCQANVKEFVETKVQDTPERENNLLDSSCNPIQNREEQKVFVNSSETSDPPHQLKSANCGPREALSNNFGEDSNEAMEELKDGSTITSSRSNSGDVDTINPGGFTFYGCFTPFGAKCEPKIYGFRGPLHIWNQDKAAYTNIYNDMVSIQSDLSQEIPFKQRSPHMCYVPYTSCSHLSPTV